jgi:hypothetical protein
MNTGRDTQGLASFWCTRKDRVFAVSHLFSCGHWIAIMPDEGLTEK